MIPKTITDKIGAGLHRNPKHPLGLITQKIEDFFNNHHNSFSIHHFEDPYVSTEANFDDLLIPKDHPSRSSSDTFYKDGNTVLRTHTSAHQTQLLRAGHHSFIAFGDCYRRDTVDQSHYPVFHQVEGVRVQPQDNLWWRNISDVEQDLKQTLESLVRHIFGETLQIKWSPDYFPFTDPSWEMEICLPGDDRWLEILGCGIVQNKILTNCGIQDSIGWAFGVGLERLAMILYSIPDIRLFWTHDPRFHKQFSNGDAQFVPYSKHPPVFKDISFWTGPDYHANYFHELARDIGQGLIEEIVLTDEFTHPKTQKTNNTFRITYRSPDRSLTNEEINQLQEQLREAVTNQLDVELR